MRHVSRNDFREESRCLFSKLVSVQCSLAPTPPILDITKDQHDGAARLRGHDTEDERIHILVRREGDSQQGEQCAVELVQPPIYKWTHMYKAGLDATISERGKSAVNVRFPKMEVLSTPVDYIEHHCNVNFVINIAAKGVEKVEGQSEQVLQVYEQE